MLHPRRIGLACRLIATVTVATMSVSLPRAQQKLGARSFFPNAYQTEVFVDVAALQDHGIWDTIERSPARMPLEQFRRAFGFDLADLDRATWAGRIVPNEDSWIGVEWVIVLEGDDRVGLGHADLAELGCERQEIGGQQVLEDGRNAYVSPTAGLLVIGDCDRIESILRGEAQGGVPDAELLPYIADKKPLARVAAMLPREVDETGRTLPTGWLDGEDRMTRAKIALTEDEQNGHFALKLFVRFENGEAGRARVRAAIEDGLSRAGEMPQFKAVRGLLKAVVIHEKDKDLVASVDLGPRDKAIGAMTQLLALSLMLSGSDGPAPPPLKAVREGPVSPGAGVEHGNEGNGKGKGKEQEGAASPSSS